MFVGVCRCLPELIGVCRCLQVITGAYMDKDRCLKVLKVPHRCL